MLQLTITRHYRTGAYATCQEFETVTPGVMADLAFAFRAAAEHPSVKKVTIELEKAVVS